MEYYKRELCFLNHQDTSTERDRADDAYQNHLYNIAPKLSHSGRRLAKLSFHDCTVQSIIYLPNNIVRIELAGERKSRDGHLYGRGLHTLIFSGVTQSTISPASAGDRWLFEEINLADRKTQYLVLLENSELMVDFARVKITTDPEKIIKVTQSISELAAGTAR